MDFQNLIAIGMSVLSVAGAIALGLPALFRAVHLFCKLIPGEQPDAFIETKLLPLSEKVAEFVGKLFPQSK